MNLLSYPPLTWPMRTLFLRSFLAASTLLVLSSLPTLAAEHMPPFKRPAAQETLPRVIVKFRADDRARIQSAQPSTTDAAQALARRAILTVKRSQDLGGRMRAMQVDTGATGETV